MTAEKKPNLAKAKMHRPAPPEEFEYVVEITEWFWEYFLSLRAGKYRDQDPYCESRDLQIAGKLLRPAGLKTEVVQISLRPRSSMNEERRKNHNPIALGALDLYPDMIKGSVGLPADVLSPIMQLLIAKELKFVVLTASKFRYRSAGITDVRLEMRLPDYAPVNGAPG
jgi:hypothetical protein